MLTKEAIDKLQQLCYVNCDGMTMDDKAEVDRLLLRYAVRDLNLLRECIPILDEIRRIDVPTASRLEKVEYVDVLLKIRAKARAALDKASECGTWHPERPCPNDAH